MERNYATVTLCIDERTCLKGGETAKTRRWRRRRAVRRSRLALYEQSSLRSSLQVYAVAYAVSQRCQSVETGPKCRSRSLETERSGRVSTPE